MLLVAIANYPAMITWHKLIVAVVLYAIASQANAQTIVGPARTVTSTIEASASASGASLSPNFSGDGRYIAFTSYAKDLLPDQQNTSYSDIVVRDLTNGTTRLVSVNSTGIGGGNGNSFSPVLSSNGQFCAFLSTATNLVQGNTNAAQQLYVRNLVNGVTEIATIGTNGIVGPGSCTAFEMTPDARFLVFISTHTNLTTNTVSARANIYVRDRWLGTTELLSTRATNSTFSSNGDCDSPRISDDGQRVVFHSTGWDLGGAFAPTGAVFLYDRNTRAFTYLASNVAAYFGSAYSVFGGAISADGSTVAFVGANSKSNLFVYNIASATTTVISNLSFKLGPLTDISADGHRVSFKELGPNSWFTPSTWVWDSILQTNYTIDPDVYDATLSPPVLSSDGRRVAFIASTSFTYSTSGTILDYQLLVRDIDAALTRVVTRSANSHQLSAGALILPPVFSPDGNSIAFACDDDQLVSDDHNHAADVFLWSWDTGETELISRRDNSRGNAAALTSAAPASHVISTNGRFVAFSAAHNTYLTDDTNTLSEIFVRDLSTGQTTLVSTDPDATLASATTPSISAEGRYVVYLRGAGFTNLSAGNVYLRDLQTGTVTLLNTNLSGIPTGDAAALSISADGRFVAFHTPASLVNADTNGLNDVYLYDIQNAALTLISAPPPGYSSAYQSSNAVFSPDNKWVVFQSRSPYLHPPSLGTTSVQLYARSLNSDVIQHVSYFTGLMNQPLPGDSTVPTFSADGQYCAFQSSNGMPVLCVHRFAGASNAVYSGNISSPTLDGNATTMAFVFTNTAGTNQIAVMTLATEKTNVISIATNAPALGNGHSTAPILTPDGRFVIYTSKAPNLISNDLNGYTDVFIRDLVLSNTIAISRVGIGTPQYGAVNPILAADGRTILFQSFSTDLTTNILTPTRNLFVVRLSTGDSDHDGMDDDWEITYFGNLTHDGSADTDGDGLTDLEEFRAGTNPINNTSVLRCLALSTSTGGTTIYWSSVPGQDYEVWVKDDLNSQTWGIFHAITATNEITSITDTNAPFSTHRFYRVQKVTPPPPF